MQTAPYRGAFAPCYGAGLFPHYRPDAGGRSGFAGVGGSGSVLGAAGDGGVGGRETGASFGGAAPAAGGTSGAPLGVCPGWGGAGSTRLITSRSSRFSERLDLRGPRSWRG